MSLRLSAPKGGIGIEAPCPETQWVQRNASPTDRDFAAWRFTFTPQKRGSHILRLTFSYREIDVNGVIADSTLPDRVFNVVVTTNVTKICAQAAVWGIDSRSWSGFGRLLPTCHAISNPALPMK